MTNPGVLRQGDSIRGRGEASEAVVAVHGGQEADECYVKDILEAVRERRWKSRRRGGGGGDREVAEQDFYEGRYGPRCAGTETGDAQV